jgi:hypothetical protein
MRRHQRCPFQKSLTAVFSDNQSGSQACPVATATGNVYAHAMPHLAVAACLLVHGEGKVSMLHACIPHVRATAKATVCSALFRCDSSLQVETDGLHHWEFFFWPRLHLILFLTPSFALSLSCSRSPLRRWRHHGD